MKFTTRLTMTYKLLLGVKSGKYEIHYPVDNDLQVVIGSKIR